MKPQDAAAELREQNVRIPLHRLAELLSVVDGELWRPNDEAGLRRRLADYMRTNGIAARPGEDEPVGDA